VPSARPASSAPATLHVEPGSRCCARRTGSSRRRSPGPAARPRAAKMPGQLAAAAGCRTRRAAGAKQPGRTATTQHHQASSTATASVDPEQPRRAGARSARRCWR
jgi:hypothetical protein